MKDTIVAHKLRVNIRMNEFNRTPAVVDYVFFLSPPLLLNSDHRHLAIVKNARIKIIRSTRMKLLSLLPRDAKDGNCTHGRENRVHHG